MVSEAEITIAATRGGWREFYERLRAGMIEAQCALESGKLVRASELIDSVMRDARRCERRICGQARPGGAKRRAARTELNDGRCP